MSDEATTWLTTSTTPSPGWAAATHESISEFWAAMRWHWIEKGVREMNQREQRQLVEGCQRGETFYLIDLPDMTNYWPLESGTNGRVVHLMAPDESGRRSKRIELFIPSAEWRKKFEGPV